MINQHTMLMTDQRAINASTALLKLLNGHSLWFTEMQNDAFNLKATDSPLLKYYWDKKYYLTDPPLNSLSQRTLVPKHTVWDIRLASDDAVFRENGCLTDLYNSFKISEFVSITQKNEHSSVCLRLFALNDRFVFINQLIHHLPIIKYFIDHMTNHLDITRSYS